MVQETHINDEFQILLMHEVTPLNTNSKDLSLLAKTIDELEDDNCRVLKIYKDALPIAEGFITMEGKSLPIYGFILNQNDYTAVNLYVSINNRLVLYVVDRFIRDNERLIDIVDDFNKQLFLFFPSKETIKYLCDATRVKYYHKHKTPFSKHTQKD